MLWIHTPRYTFFQGIHTHRLTCVHSIPFSRLLSPSIPVSLVAYFKYTTTYSTVSLHQMFMLYITHSSPAQCWENLVLQELPGCGRIALKGRKPETVRLLWRFRRRPNDFMSIWQNGSYIVIPCHLSESFSLDWSVARTLSRRLLLLTSRRQAVLSFQ